MGKQKATKEEAGMLKANDTEMMALRRALRDCQAEHTRIWEALKKKYGLPSGKINGLDMTTREFYNL